MLRLTGYGLRLASQLPVPGAVADDGDVLPDVTIALESSRPTGAAPIYDRIRDGLNFVCPGVASYRIAPDMIAVAPDPAAAPGMVSGMLVATALPALLWLRGRFVLHAGAARLPGGVALAIAGESGRGKSTILAQLVESGAALIGDDTIAFDMSADQPASGLSGGWFAAAEAGSDRCFVAAAPAKSLAAAPIAAILVLEERGGEEGDIARLDPVVAVVSLLANRHRPRIPALLGRTAETLRDATLLAGAIPLYSWRRRAGVEALTPTEWTVLKRLGTGREIE